MKSPACQKLIIHYLISREEWQKPKHIDTIAEYFEIMDEPFPTIDNRPHRDVLKEFFTHFYSGVKNSFSELGIDGNHSEIAEHMQSCDFVFSGNLKKINKDWSIRWRYEKYLEYFFYNRRNNREIRFLKWMPCTIRHKDYLDKFILDENKFKITETRSDCYWIFNLQDESVSYISPRADAGLAHSQYNLAVSYLGDSVIPRDLNTAKDLLEKAADQGFKKAEVLLKKVCEELENTSKPFNQ